MASLNESYSKLKALTSSIEYDLTNLTTKKTKVSATRLRAQLMAINKLTSEMRKSVLTFQKELPTRSKKAVAEEVEAQPEPLAEAEIEPVVVAEPVPKKRGRKAKVVAV